MWRSFGGSSGMGWGGAGARGGGGYGGGGGGGGMFRTVTRVSRAGLSNLQDHSSPSPSSSSSFSTSSPKKASKRGLSVSSKSADLCATSVVLSNSNLGFGPAWPLSSASSFSDESDWVCIHDESERTEIETDIVSLDDCVFGSAPSSIEAQAALISLQNTLPTSCHSDSDWIEPYPYGGEQSICSDIGRVYDAFHLLQTEPSIQRMVISLSSDKAVWNAVLNNEAVQELKEAIFRKDEINALETSGDEPNPSSSPGNVLSWIFNNMRAKFMEFLTGFTDLMKDVFQPPSDDMGKFPDGFGELVRAAFMLTAIVLLIVVVTRASHA